MRKPKSAATAPKKPKVRAVLTATINLSQIEIPADYPQDEDEISEVESAREESS